MGSRAYWTWASWLIRVAATGWDGTPVRWAGARSWRGGEGGEGISEIDGMSVGDGDEEERRGGFEAGGVNAGGVT